MLVIRSLSFEKAKINRLAENAITMPGNQVIETYVINMAHSRVPFKITAEGNFSMGVQQQKVNTSL